MTHRLVASWRFVDRYVTMAGKSCCAGRSWVGLNRSLARRCATDARPGEAPRSAEEGRQGL